LLPGTIYELSIPYSSIVPHFIHISGQKSTGEAASVDGISLSPCGDVCVHGPHFEDQICIIGESVAMFGVECSAE